MYQVGPFSWCALVSVGIGQAEPASCHLLAFLGTPGTGRDVEAGLSSSIVDVGLHYVQCIALMQSSTESSVP